MNETKKVQYLVVDTSAFIRNAPLQDIGINIITEEDVVHEVTNKRQLRRLVVLPYDLTVQNASPENIKFVTEFAKKTGDYTSLSATDIKVIALTYQLEKEKIGTDHLRTEPLVAQTTDSSKWRIGSIENIEDLRTPVAGFYVPEKKKNVEKKSTEESNLRKLDVETNLENNIKNIDHEKEEKEDKDESDFSESSDDFESDYETANSDIDYIRTEDLSSKFSALTCESTEFIVKDKNNTEHNVDDILVPVKEKYDNNKNESNEYEIDHIGDDDDAADDGDDDDDDDDYDDNDDDDDDDNDNDGWITPGNIFKIKKQLDSDFLEEKPVIVACLTIDFAMQNVLKQIGLNVVALDGRIIKQMRTFIFRCYACFKTTSIMTKVFCPSCGNKTLKRVAVTLNAEGKQQIHINFRRPISKKGKRFSLPMPKGGKHANNPILCEDQPIPDQKLSRLARMKNDPLQDDYIAGYSPFIMRDVHSKSAMLGIRSEGSVKYWMRKNPNEVRRRRK